MIFHFNLPLLAELAVNVFICRALAIESKCFVSLQAFDIKKLYFFNYYYFFFPCGPHCCITVTVRFTDVCVDVSVYICRYILFYTEREWCWQRYFLLLGLHRNTNHYQKEKIRKHPRPPRVPKSPLFGFASGTDIERLWAELRGQSGATPEWLWYPEAEQRGERGQTPRDSFFLFLFLILFSFFSVLS